MAGNIVKWWKHKILGGYKQFTVQECTTDSEELMYHQASSSCSAPPDLLLVGERDSGISIPLHSPVVNIISTKTNTTLAAASSTQSQVAASATTTLETAKSSSCVGKSAQIGSCGSAATGVLVTTTTTKHAHNGTKASTHKNSKVSNKSNGKLLTTQHPPTAHSSNQHAFNAHHHHHHHLRHHGQNHQQHDEYAVTVAEMIESSQQEQQSHKHNNGTGDKAEERIRLEEFTCDVSVEGRKSSQPLQFSFTFYDLDGHHGKITKDDIVGIVYTIYESIGKSVVVPHFGSKTINVRLTVSPEAKSKSTTNPPNVNVSGLGGSEIGKFKKLHTSAADGLFGHLHSSSTVSALKARHTVNTTTGISTTVFGSSYAPLGSAGRRQHRYRPRKLIKSDDEDDDSNSERERELSSALASRKAISVAGGGSGASFPNAMLTKSSKSHMNKYNKMKLEREFQRQQQQQTQRQCCSNNQKDNFFTTDVSCSIDCHHCMLLQNLYENMSPTNSKYCHQNQQHQQPTKDVTAVIPMLEEYQLSGCSAVTPTLTAKNEAGQTTTLSNDVYMKQASARVKMLRKARKQKYQDHCYDTRQRSLSVGNDNSNNWKKISSNRHLVSATTHNSPVITSFSSNHNQGLDGNLNVYGSDVVDGVQLRNSHKALDRLMPTKESSSECWKTALNRNDLIGIIRESMEKNRLCFQLNGKPQANVSPIRQPPLPLPSQSPVPPSNILQQPPQQRHQQKQHQVSQKAQLRPIIPATTTTTQIVKHIHQHHRSSLQHQHHHQQQEQPQQRQRANTVSKIPTLISNHINSPTTTANSTMVLMSNNKDNNNKNYNENDSKYFSTRKYINNNNKNENNNNKNNSNNNNDTSYNNNSEQQQQTDNKSHNSSNKSSNKLQHYHLHPHIPIYHQEMRVNPVIQSTIPRQHQQSKMNICGYDSYLHASYCDGGTTTTAVCLSPKSSTNNNYNYTNNNFCGPQPIAAVQPLLTLTTTNSPLHDKHQQQDQQQQQMINTSKNNLVPMKTTTTVEATTNTMTKTVTTTSSNLTNVQQSRILHNTSLSQQQQQHILQQNSPQYHGYQRLISSASTTAMQQQQQQPIAAIGHVEKWLRQNSKFVYKKHASLLTTLTPTSTPIERKCTKLLDYTEKENTPQQHLPNKMKLLNNKQRQHRYKNNRSGHHSPIATTISNCGKHIVGSMKNDYISLIPLNGDSIECENLLSQTTDDELVTSAELIIPTTICVPATTTATPAAVFVHQATTRLLPTSSEIDNENKLIDLHNVSQHQQHQDIVKDFDIDVVVTPTDTIIVRSELEADVEENESEFLPLKNNDNNNIKLISKLNVNNNNNNNNTSMSSSTSSLIHRYVHEHIHHHYHHFKDKKD